VYEYVFTVVRAPVLSGPAVDFTPLQSPEAVQEVASFVTSQVSVELSPEYIDVGTADNVTVGRSCAFPVPPCSITPTLTVANPVPVAVLQVRVNRYVWTTLSA
jgi:hypothetical protein